MVTHFDGRQLLLINCSDSQYAVMDCEIESLTAEPLACYTRRLEATAVVDCSIKQSTLVDCGFSCANGITV